MGKFFKLFDSDFAPTNNTDGANYIVLTNPTKAMDELFNYWLDSDNFTCEIEKVEGHWKYYYWEDNDERYLPLTDNVVIEKLNEIISSSCSDSSESVSTKSESSEVNTADSTLKKYKLYITLENGTVIEPNYTSADPADFAGEIELMSSERYFAGKIKSIKIE